MNGLFIFQSIIILYSIVFLPELYEVILRLCVPENATVSVNHFYG